MAAAGLALAPFAGFCPVPTPIGVDVADGPTYADLATLSNAADLVIRAKIRRQTALEPERAPGLAAGFARLYIEAQTVALIAGRSAGGAKTSPISSTCRSTQRPRCPS